MRFKSRMAAEHIHLLHSIITPISRLTTTSDKSIIGSGSTIYLDSSVLRISSRGGGSSRGGCVDNNTSNSQYYEGTEGIACFAELVAVNGIFLEHKIESIAGNVIVFDIDLVQFRTALAATLQSMGSGSDKAAPLHNSSGEGRNSFDNSQFRASFVVVMKLAKRSGMPCLCLDASCVNGTLDVHHAVPVRILRAEEWQNHLPPIVNTPDVQLEFQLERPLRPVIERLKSISPIIYIDGSMSGELVLRVENDGVSIRTFYDKLVPRVDDDEEEETNQEFKKKCTLKIDSKKLLAALQWQSSMGRGAVGSYIVCMIQNEMLVVHVMLNPEDLGFFTYYVPVHYIGGDVLD